MNKTFARFCGRHLWKSPPRVGKSYFATSNVEGQVPGRGMISQFFPLILYSTLSFLAMTDRRPRNDDYLIRYNMHPFPFPDAARDEVAVARRRVVAR